MNLHRLLLENIYHALVTLQQEQVLPTSAFDALSLECLGIEVSPPRDPSHGDLATNAALVLAKPCSMNPRALAEALKGKLQDINGVASVEIAGPGFINLRMAHTWWQNIIPHILEAGIAYGDRREEKDFYLVNVEYVSANPTGPLHIGHARGAVYGDALANLLEKTGYKVIREYYINDAGAQVNVLARSAYLRYREACGENIGAIPEGLYPGEYLIPVGEALKEKYGTTLLGKPEEEWLALIRDFAIDAMMALIRRELADMGITHEVFSSERALHENGKVEEAVAALNAKGLVYEGVLEPPKGKEPEDWEPRPQMLFRASQFGDDTDRPLKKADGTWTYFTPDIAYHYDKLQRGAMLLIDILGADHQGYAPRIRAAVGALSDGKARIEFKFCQLVKVLREGVPVKMSKRAGNFITAAEVLEEIGAGALRFIMLTRKNDAPLDFDLVTVKEASKDNPVFYVQYAHARCQSVLRMAETEVPVALTITNPSLLTQPEELALIRELASWPRLVEGAARALEPHRVAFYLHDVASAFHAWWNTGKDNMSLRFLRKDDINLSGARLALVRATALTLASGLRVMGVEPVDEMR